MFAVLAAASLLATLPCGTTEHSLNVSGTTRTFHVVANPAACGQEDGKTYAVVVCIHGWRQSDLWACEAMCAPYAASHSFIGLCPLGLGGEDGESGWNTQPGNGHLADDLGFIRNAIAYVHDRSGNRIPKQRTFAIGFSFGGGMVYRLMCEASDIIFGFAVVAQPGPFSQQASIYGSGHGSSWSQSCHPAIRRPLWASIGAIDGIFDAVMARDGWLGISRAALGCETAALLTLPSQGLPPTNCQQLVGCTGFAPDRPASEFCTHAALGHYYPSTPAFDAGITLTRPTTLDATEAAWSFWTNGQELDLPAAPPMLPSPP